MERLAFDLIRKGKHDRIEGDWRNVVYANFNRIPYLRSLIAAPSNRFPLDNFSSHDIQSLTNRKYPKISPHLNQKASS